MPMQTNERLCTMTIESPLGPLRLYARDDELAGLYLPTGESPQLVARDLVTPVLAQTAAQLREYFAGVRREFDLPVVPRGTGFQERVWRELTKIPFGETRSY